MPTILPQSLLPSSYDTVITLYSEPATFTVSSGKLRVTDPCYEIDTWCAGTLQNVKNGEWVMQQAYFRDQSNIAANARYRQHELDIAKLCMDRCIKATKEQAIQVDSHNEVWIRMHDQQVAELKRRWAEEDAVYRGEVAYIRIIHSEYQQQLTQGQLTLDDFTKSDIHVGVDSGQAGFFDFDQFALHAGKTPLHKEFYDTVRKMSRSDGQGGVVLFGANSRTAYGDGGYDCFIRTNDAGEIFDAVIVFLHTFEDDEDEKE